MSAKVKLKRLCPSDIRSSNVIDLSDDVIKKTGEIVQAIVKGGLEELIGYANKFSDINIAGKYCYCHQELEQSFLKLEPSKQSLLLNVVDRITTFANQQKLSIKEFEYEVDGAKVGQKIVPVQSVCCYVPGGKYSLISSLLMTAVTAKVAEVNEIYVTSPRPSKDILAAAYVVGAKRVYSFGGAQAITAFAYGIGDIPQCSMIVGPGNKYVTAAKYLVSSKVGIDLLAGPSELLIIADQKASPKLIAADMLAQAEHDPDARAMLLVFSEEIIPLVEEELEKQLEKLSTKDIAGIAIKSNAFVVCVNDQNEAVKIADKIAPEHLQLMFADAENIYTKFSNYGGVFVGSYAAEVFADYGIGPNHVLPTSGTAKFSSGLSVLNFLKLRTYVEAKNPIAPRILQETKKMAEWEGLFAHASSVTSRQ